MVVDLKESQISVAERLEISNPAVSKLVNRGREVEKEMGIDLFDNP